MDARQNDFVLIEMTGYWVSGLLYVSWTLFPQLPNASAYVPTSLVPLPSDMTVQSPHQEPRRSVSKTLVKKRPTKQAKTPFYITFPPWGFCYNKRKWIKTFDFITDKVFISHSKAFRGRVCLVSAFNWIRIPFHFHAVLSTLPIFAGWPHLSVGKLLWLFQSYIKHLSGVLFKSQRKFQ